MFSNLCLTLALLTNAVIIGSATNLLSNMDAGAVAKKSQLDGINGYMRFRKVGGRGPGGKLAMDLGLPEAVVCGRDPTVLRSSSYMCSCMAPMKYSTRPS